MTVTAADYQALVKRLEILRQQRAVLLSKEEDKAAERRVLEEALIKLGVDLTKPEEELQRLQNEVEADFRRQEELVNQFQTALEDKPAAPAPSTPPTPSLEPATATTAADALDLP